MTDIRGVQIEVGQEVVVITNRHGKFSTYRATVLAVGAQRVTVDRNHYREVGKCSVLPNHIAVL